MLSTATGTRTTAPTSPADLIAFHTRPPATVPRRPATSRRVRAAWQVWAWRRMLS